MPDIRPAVDHTHQLARIEADLVRDERGIYDDLRRELAEVLGSRGPRGLTQVLPTSLEATRRALRRRLEGAGEQVARRSETFAVRELDGLAQLLEDSPRSPATAIAATAAARAQLQAAEVARAMSWLDGVGGLMLAEAWRLELAGTPADVAAARLVAPTIAVDGRASLWSGGLGPLALAATNLVFGLDNAGRGAIYRAAQPAGQRYQKQVIAAIDARTTDCCRRAHGQIQPLDTPFVLTGTPRFSSRMMQPPFHYRCRTVTVLYHPAMERVGPTTAQLRAQVRKVAA